MSLRVEVRGRGSTSSLPLAGHMMGADVSVSLVLRSSVIKGDPARGALCKLLKAPSQQPGGYGGGYWAQGSGLHTPLKGLSVFFLWALPPQQPARTGQGMGCVPRRERGRSVQCRLPAPCLAPTGNLSPWPPTLVLAWKSQAKHIPQLGPQLLAVLREEGGRQHFSWP